MLGCGLEPASQWLGAGVARYLMPVISPTGRGEADTHCLATN